MPKNSGPKAKKAAKKSTPKKQVGTCSRTSSRTSCSCSITVTPSATEVETVSLEDQFKDILTRLQEFRNMSNALMADVRKLQKNVAKQVRESIKKNKKRQKVRSGDSKRPPSGFAKPALISDALCQFLGVSKGSEMARTEGY